MIPNIPNPIHESLVKDFRDACPPPTCPKCGKEMSFRHGDVVFCEEDNVVVDVTGKNYLTAFKNVEITTGESFFDMAKDLSSVMKTWAIRDFDGIIDIQISMRPEQPTPEWMIMSLFVVGTPKQSM